MKKTKRVGLLANQASIDKKFVHTADKLGAMGYELVALFSPQQGFYGEVQANMIETGHSHDSERGVPLYSLYSSTRRPTPEMLKGIELIIVDLQDVGARGYTFVWTLLYMMEECATQGIPMLILDRPNPIGGAVMEGPLLKPDYFSFVGLHDIPIRYGLTIGELAQLMRAEKNISVELKVKPIAKWHRKMYFEDSGLSWVMTSANVPTATTTILYPGMELFEGTNISEGRGTTRPFELFGAPFLESTRLCDQLNRQKLTGVTFRPTTFQPTFDKWKGESCFGAQIHLTDPKKVQSVSIAVAILRTVNQFYPEKFRFTDPPYEYEKRLKPFDILAGSSELREQISQSVPLKAIVAGWQGELQKFKRRCRDYLLYR